MMKLFKKFYNDNFERFTEFNPPKVTEKNPEQTIVWLKGRKRRKIIDTQFTD